MSHASRRALVLAILAFAFASFVSACSSGSQGPNAVGTSGQADSAIGLEIASGASSITVENRAAFELIRVDVAINVNRSAPPALRGPFIAKVSRMAAGEKRLFQLGEFAASGARINLNAVRPQEVVVTASDSDGKKYETRVAWKP
jgi:hypothetical protein